MHEAAAPVQGSSSNVEYEQDTANEQSFATLSFMALSIRERSQQVS
jgi:hypothetical protein